jgi:hypothetical protein
VGSHPRLGEALALGVVGGPVADGEVVPVQSQHRLDGLGLRAALQQAGDEVEDVGVLAGLAGTAL